MDRTSQGERLESTDGEIFHQAKTHALLPLFPVYRTDMAAISGAIRDAYQQDRTASFMKSQTHYIKKAPRRLDGPRPLQRDRMLVLQKINKRDENHTLGILE
jgi:hypothetical protein